VRQSWLRFSERPPPAKVKWIAAGLCPLRGSTILMRRREGVARPELRQNRRDAHATAAMVCGPQVSLVRRAPVKARMRPLDIVKRQIAAGSIVSGAISSSRDGSRGDSKLIRFLNRKPKPRPENSTAQIRPRSPNLGSYVFLSFGRGSPDHWHRAHDMWRLHFQFVAECIKISSNSTF
jgi:hypothetical protein